MHALELYDDSAHRSLLFRFSVDPKSVAMTNYGWSLCLRGWPEQAWNWERRALEYTKELAHPFSLVNALMMAIFVRHFRGEYDEALVLMPQFTALASEHGLTEPLLRAEILWGAILIGRGELERGCTMLTADLAQFRTTAEGQLYFPFFLSFLADALLQQGQVENGLATVTEALCLSETNLDRFWEAEIYRLKGELLLNAERRMQNDERKTKKKGRASSPIHHSSLIVPRRRKPKGAFIRR